MGKLLIISLILCLLFLMPASRYQEEYPTNRISGESLLVTESSDVVTMMFELVSFTKNTKLECSLTVPGWSTGGPVLKVA